MPRSQSQNSVIISMWKDSEERDPSLSISLKLPSWFQLAGKVENHCLSFPCFPPYTSCSFSVLLFSLIGLAARLSTPRQSCRRERSLSACIAGSNAFSSSRDSQIELAFPREWWVAGAWMGGISGPEQWVLWQVGTCCLDLCCKKKGGPASSELGNLMSSFGEKRKECTIYSICEWFVTTLSWFNFANVLSTSGVTKKILNLKICPFLFCYFMKMKR